MTASDALVERFVSLTMAHHNEVITAWVIAVDDRGLLYQGPDYVWYDEGNDNLPPQKIAFTDRSRYFVPWSAIQSIRIHPHTAFMNTIEEGVELIGEGVAIFDR